MHATEVVLIQQRSITSHSYEDEDLQDVGPTAIFRSIQTKQSSSQKSRTISCFISYSSLENNPDLTTFHFPFLTLTLKKINQSNFSIHDCQSTAGVTIHYYSPDTFAPQRSWLEIVPKPKTFTLNTFYSAPQMSLSAITPNLNLSNTFAVYFVGYKFKLKELRKWHHLADIF